VGGGGGGRLYIDLYIDDIKREHTDMKKKFFDNSVETVNTLTISLISGFLEKSDLGNKDLWLWLEVGVEDGIVAKLGGGGE
jgi:hypothetical protein